MDKIIIEDNDILLYPVKCDIPAVTSYALDIWEKFGNHFTDDEKTFMKKIDSKDVHTFLPDEFKRYMALKKQLMFAELLPKYRNHNCSKKEHDFVADYMNSSLRNFVESKITDEQRDSAHSFIDILKEKDSLAETIKGYEAMFPYISLFGTYLYISAKEAEYNILKREEDERIKRQKQKEFQNLINHINKDFGV